MKRGRKEAPPPSRVPTREDGLQAEMTDAARKAAVGALKPLLAENPHRLLRTLTPGEVDSVVVAVIAAYTQIRALLQVREDFDDDLDDILPLA